ncbi:GntR family transcriptional regulator [Limimaricola pyoseonensis]|uniref:DNA-binding transcriptional regulator, GntR family n=1 Tax=Limimaricola pyoseonensis TaxID=521013 RepID=A0A1G7FVC7_9RHOB|nr:GntR family transcriptional regulator [Limimaricola pyoseonensis]SDE79814.1 DNA-binding transcriptional regulator, GntR family [Limimaricola pyoseonensis]
MLDLPEIDRAPSMTAQEYVYARLRNAVMVGAVQPESPLTIRGLAAELGISPTPIREALRRLSSERAIALLENRRITIPEMTGPRFEEIVQLRCALECHAAARALPHVSAVLVDRMREVDDRMDAHVRAGDLDALTIDNHAFHSLLYTANPHQTVMPVIESVWLQLGPFQRRVLGGVERYYEVDRHKEILAALEARDAGALVAAIAADIRDGIERAGLAVLRGQAAQ